jgi:hypothetical protein
VPIWKKKTLQKCRAGGMLISKKPLQKSRGGGVAQSVGPQFKRQHCKKKKNPKNHIQLCILCNNW